MPVYILDTNFFIQAHRYYYPLDIAVGFWGKVRQLAQAGKIISIDKVKNEIYANEDALKEWCVANLPLNFFMDSSLSIGQYQRLVIWASSNTQYLKTAKDVFLNVDEADAFLVSYCMSDIQNRVLVTHEISKPDSRKSIKIPDACMPHQVSFINPIEMFRQLGETF